jgi:hypothetical protein
VRLVLAGSGHSWLCRRVRRSNIGCFSACGSRCARPAS